MNYALENCEKYGSMYRVWILNQLAVFSIDPRDVEVILSSTQQITKNNLYNLMLPWLGTGLLMSFGRKWHSRRKVMIFVTLSRFRKHYSKIEIHLYSQLGEKTYSKTART